MRRKRGKIIPNGVSLEKHENDIVVIFTDMGMDVELIPPDRRRQKKTADAVIAGLEWEFKTPHGGTTRSIQHIMKKAASQSENLVLDLRLLSLPEDMLLRKATYEFHQTRSLKRLKVILPPAKLIDIE